MTNLAKNISTEIEELMSKLLTNLEEKIFFVELSRFLVKRIEADSVNVYLVNEDSAVRQLVCNGRSSRKSQVEKSQGIVGYVIRTKRPYFSNSVERDPLFAGSVSDDVKSEMCIPVSHEGIIVATINFQIKKGSEKSFSQNEITGILSVLGQLKTPIANIKMYLQAKNLNEILLKQIELKEKELAKKENGIHLLDSHKIEEKKILGMSEKISKLIKLSDKLACVAANFVIEGEHGVGKELFARRIHCKGLRSDNAFVSVDCSSLNEQMLETELFGEEKALSPVKRGLLEIANGGTIVIKNVTGMSIRIQGELFNFLEKGSATRVGGCNSYSSNVRIIVTTNKNLQEEVEEGAFREDFYYSIAKMTLKIPALRELGDDIELLANHYLNKNRNIDELKTLAPCAIKLLSEYSWPGNIRELSSVMERAYILADGIIVEKDHLMDKVFEGSVNVSNQQPEEEIEFVEMTLEDLEQRHICLTLDRLGGNKTKTAKTLGITVKTLYNKLHNYGMIEQKEA